MGLEITIASNSSSLAPQPAARRRTGNERKLFSCIFDAARNGRQSVCAHSCTSACKSVRTSMIWRQEGREWEISNFHGRVLNGKRCLGNPSQVENYLPPRSLIGFPDTYGVETNYYRVSHLVANLGWVELNLGSSLGWLAIQWVATAQAGWWNIPNPCQQNPVRDQMGHPVETREQWPFRLGGNA